MNKEQLQYLKIGITVILSAITAYATVQKSLIILVAAIPIAFAILIIARRSVKEILADERDFQTAGEASLLAMQIYCGISSVVVLLLLGFRDFNPYYEAIGSTLAFSVCFFMILYSVIFRYKNSAGFSQNKNLYLIAAGLVMILLAIAGIRLFSGEDSWICEKGTWVQHGNPDYAKPTIECK